MPTGVFANQAIITNDLSDNCPIHLLHKIQVSFLIWAPPREYNVFLLTVCHQFLIEEFSTVIGIDAQDGKRKERMCILDGYQKRLPTAIPLF
jgi:hypothetical protein